MAKHRGWECDHPNQPRDLSHYHHTCFFEPTAIICHFTLFSPQHRGERERERELYGGGVDGHLREDPRGNYVMANSMNTTIIYPF